MPKTPPSGRPPGDDASLTFDEEATPVPGIVPGATFDEEAERPTPPRANAAPPTPPAPPTPKPPAKPVTGARPAVPAGAGALDSQPGRPGKVPSGSFDSVSGPSTGLRRAVVPPPPGKQPHRPATGSFTPLGGPPAKPKTGLNAALSRPATGSFAPLGGELPSKPTSGVNPAVSAPRPATGSFAPLGGEAGAKQRTGSFSPLGDPVAKPKSGVNPAVSAPRAGSVALGGEPPPKPKMGLNPALTRPATGLAPAFEPSRGPSTSGVRPAVARPATGLAPAFNPANPQTGSFVPVGSRDEAELKADPSIDAAALQREVRARALGTPGGETKKSATSAQPAFRPPPKPVEGKPTDTFVKRKMKEAEGNLADLDFDFPDDT